jgi:hypothetical protein
MRSLLSSCLVALALAASVACQEDEPRPPPAGDLPQAPPLGVGAGGGGGGGGEGGAGGADGGLDAGACTDLSNEGIVVDQNGVIGDPPTGVGGAVAEGTYELTAASIYVGAGGTPGPTGIQIQGALRLQGGTFVRVHERALQGQPPQEARTSGSFASGGTTFSLATDCPSVAADDLSYSVVANTLVLTSLVTRESYTFTLR